MLYRKNCEYALSNAYYFSRGESRNAYDFLGSHRIYEENGKYGYSFVLYDKNAVCAYVVGDFNDGRRIAMEMIGDGIWYAVYESPISIEGCFYEYLTGYKDNSMRRCYDPFSNVSFSDGGKIFSTVRNENSFEWNDKKYMSMRKNRSPALHKSVNIYEARLSRGMNYREMSKQLALEASKLQFTHVKIEGVRESFGDSAFSACFTPSSRYGSSDDFSYLVDTMHSLNVGVIAELFPCGKALSRSDINTREDMSLFLSSAFFWIRNYHVDGIYFCAKKEFFAERLKRAVAKEINDSSVIIKVG